MTNTINEYTDEQGKSPYAQWLGALQDVRAKAKIIMQVDKMELGLFGDVERAAYPLWPRLPGLLRQRRSDGVPIALWW